MIYVINYYVDMAHVPESPHHNGGGDKNPNRPGMLRRTANWLTGRQPPKDDPIVLKFRKSEIMNRQDTYENLDKYRRNQTVTKGLESREAGISESLMTSYTEFLNDHVRHLIELRRRNPALLNTPQHEYDKRLLEALAVDGQVVESKVKEFLSKPEGMMIANTVLEHKTAILLFGLTLHAASVPRGDRVGAVRGMNDQPYFGRPPRTIGGGTIPGIPPINLGPIHTPGTPPITLPTVTVVPGAPPGNAPGRDNVYTGDDAGFARRVQQNIYNFLATGSVHVAGRPLDRGQERRLNWITRGALIGANVAGASLAASLGIITGDFALPAAIMGNVVGYQVLSRLNRYGLSTELQQCGAVFDAIKNNPVEAEYVREMAQIYVDDFQHTGNNRFNRVDRRTIDPQTIASELKKNLDTRKKFFVSMGFPEKNIDALPEQFIYQGDDFPEQLRSKINMEVYQRYRDIMPIGPSRIEDRITVFHAARQQVMVEYLESFTSGKAVFNRELQAAAGAIDAKIAARTGDGEAIKAQKDRLNNTKKAVDEDKTTVDETKTGAYTPYETKLKEIRDLQRQYDEAFTAVPGANAAAKVAYLTDQLSNFGVAGTFAQRYRDYNTRYAAALTLARSRITLGPRASADEVRAADAKAREEADTLFEVEAARLNQERERLINQYKALSDTPNQLSELQRQFSEATEVVRNVAENIVALQTEYATLTGWGLTNVQLETETVEQLLARINAMAPPAGWPAADNNRDNRNRVLNAMLHARAEAAANRDPNRAARLPNFATLTNPAQLNISEHQLRIMSVDQLVAEVGTRWNVAWGTAPTAAEIRRAKDEAMQRFEVRNEAHTRLSTAINRESERIGRQIENPAVGPELQRLQVVKDAMDRQGAVFANAADVIERIADFNMNPITADRYTAAEVALAQPRGYYELMNILFNYQNRGDREAYFRKISTALPPQQLANVLDASLLGLVPPFTINDVLTEMQFDVAAGNLQYENIRGALRNVINDLVARTGNI